MAWMQGYGVMGKGEFHANNERPDFHKLMGLNLNSKLS